MHVRGSLSEAPVHYKQRDGHTCLCHGDCLNTRAGPGVHLQLCGSSQHCACLRQRHSWPRLFPPHVFYSPAFSYFQWILINDVYLCKKTWMPFIMRIILSKWINSNAAGHAFPWAEFLFRITVLSFPWPFGSLQNPTVVVASSHPRPGSLAEHLRLVIYTQNKLKSTYYPSHGYLLCL